MSACMKTYSRHGAYGTTSTSIRIFSISVSSAIPFSQTNITDTIADAEVTVQEILTWPRAKEPAEEVERLIGILHPTLVLPWANLAILYPGIPIMFGLHFIVS